MSNSVLKLEGILSEWITGNHLQSVTRSTLEEALAGPVIGLPLKAETLSMENSLLASKKPQLDVPDVSSMTIENPMLTPIGSNLDSTPLKCVPEIVYQSTATRVVYGKSTLLEVQIDCSSPVSYQWFKDGMQIFTVNYINAPLLLYF